MVVAETTCFLYRLVSAADYNFCQCDMQAVTMSCALWVQGSHMYKAESSGSHPVKSAGLFIAARLSDKPILGSFNYRPAQPESTSPSRFALKHFLKAIPDESTASVMQILLRLATLVAVTWVWVLELAQALIVLTVPPVMAVIATALGFLTSPDSRTGVKWCLAEGLPGQSYARWSMHLASQTGDCVIRWLNTASSAVFAKAAGFTEVLFACRTVTI